MQKEHKKTETRTLIGTLVSLVLTAATLAFSLKLGDRRGYITGVLIIIYSFIPFLVSFESRKPQARELVTIAVLSALAAVSRVAFIMIPHFKPIIGIIFISGMGMGPGAGFMVGAISAMASNIVFGQGAWTPWQMLAYGIAGIIGGLLSQKGILKADKRLPAAVVAAVVSIVIVGPVLDTCALFLGMNEITAGSALATYASGLPVNAVLAVASFITVFICGKPMLEKLDRIKIKYGLMETGSFENG